MGDFKVKSWSNNRGYWIVCIVCTWDMLCFRGNCKYFAFMIPFMYMKKELFDATEILWRAGYRATPGRIRLLEVLSKEDRPLTIDQIHAKMGRKNINGVTLYRAIDALVASGVIRLVNLRGHAHSYELAHHHHHHIICTRCNAIEDFSDNDCEALISRVARKSSRFTVVNDHSIELFGLCRSCAQ